MGKSKKRSGSNGSNVSNKGNATKTEKKSNGKTSKKEDVKISEVVSVTNDTLVLVNDVNAETPECWNTTPEDTDKQSKNHQSKTGTSIKKKEEVKKSQVVSVTKDTLVPVKAKNNVNAEPFERRDKPAPEDTDKRSKNHQANIGTQIKKKNNEHVQTPSGSNDQVVFDAKTSRVTKQNYDVFDRNERKKSDVEFDNYRMLLSSHGNIEYTKVLEIDEDLFKLSKDYSLAHCVAEDLNMGSGIAVQFSNLFKRHGELTNQRQKQGGLAILSFPPRFIYYLVTKKYSNGKPTLQTLWNSLTKMQRHVQENCIKQVAIPRIGCGLDRLDWNDVKFMIEHIFKDTDVTITVCNFQQDEVAAPRSTYRKCRIVNASYPVSEIAGGTMIIYFGSEDGFVDNSLEELDKKFRFLSDYKRGPRTSGQVVRTDVFKGEFILFGFIVKKSSKNLIDYEMVQKCAQEVNKVNKRFGNEGYQYVGLDMFQDPPNEEMMFHKVLNILRSTIREADIYICYPKDLMHLMPRERTSDY